MEPARRRRAVAAAQETAAAQGLGVDDAVVLNDSNRIAVRLVPCDVLARVAPVADRSASRLELDVARRLTAAGAPVAGLDPRVEPVVHERDGFAITLWTYVAPVGTEPSPAEYGAALVQLHAGLRRIEVDVPSFTDRVAEAQALLADRDRTPALGDDGRELLVAALDQLGPAVRDGGTGEQVLHGEPHLGNVLRSDRGLLFFDLTTCCRGPVEFDLAHSVTPSAEGRMLRSAAAVAAHYPGADPVLVDRSRALILAMITTWRWDRDDQLPDGARFAVEGLDQLRAALGR